MISKDMIFENLRFRRFSPFFEYNKNRIYNKFEGYMKISKVPKKREDVRQSFDCQGY